MVQRCPIVYSLTCLAAWGLAGIGDHRSAHMEKIQLPLIFLCDCKDDCTKLFKKTQGIPV